VGRTAVAGLLTVSVDQNQTLNLEQRKVMKLRDHHLNQKVGPAVVTLSGITTVGQSREALIICIFALPPKPAHLQSPERGGQHRARSPAAGKVAPRGVSGAQPGLSAHRDYGGSLSCVTLTQNYQGSPSPVRGGGSNFLNAGSGAHISPARQAQGIPKLTSCPVSGSPSPGKRGIQSCSPLREGGHSPAKLSPRNHSPLMGKLRTPSPVQKRMGSYSPAKNSKSWLGLHRISSDNPERQEKKRGKSLSVPDLVVYMNEDR